jgi:hypothetical protein
MRKGSKADIQTLRFSLGLRLGALLLESVVREGSVSDVQPFGLSISALLLEAVVRERSISNVQPLGFGIGTLLLESVVGKRTVADVQPLGFGIGTLLLESVVGKRTVADVQALSLCVAGDLIVSVKRLCALRGCILTAGTATGAASAPATSRVDKTKHFMVAEDRGSFRGVLNTRTLDD